MNIFTSIRASLLGIFALIVSGLSAQDIHFTEVTQSPLTVNPSLAGTTAWIRAGLIYRTQWHSVTVPYKTLGASFDIKAKKHWLKVTKQTERYRKSGDDGFGWGINIYNDRAGDGQMGILQANASIAYQIMMGDKSMLAAGFQGGMVQRSINYDKLYWGNQYDPNFSAGYDPGKDPKENRSSDHFIIPDLSAGLVYTYKKNERYMRGNDARDITLGAAMFHVNRPKYSFLGTSEKLAPRIVLHGFSTIGLSNTSLAILPAFMFSKQGPNSELLVGSMVRYMLQENSKVTGFVKGSAISIGGYYRNRDAFALAAMYEFSSYGIGVSYDINVSGLKAVSSGRGGFEICLKFMNPSPFVFSQASFGK